MDEKFRIYAGIDVPPKFKLDDHANMIPVQQKPVIQSESLTPEVAADLGAVKNVVGETRPAVREVVEDEEALKIYYRMLEHISDGDYGKAYGLFLDTGVSVADSDSFIEILDDVILDALYEQYAGKENLPLLYLLGEDFDVKKLVSLDDFIKLVYRSFCKEYSPERSQRVLHKLKGLFDGQVDFDEPETEE